jgi:hypothetical protein
MSSGHWSSLSWQSCHGMTRAVGREQAVGAPLTASCGSCAPVRPGPSCRRAIPLEECAAHASTSGPRPERCPRSSPFWPWIWSIAEPYEWMARKYCRHRVHMTGNRDGGRQCSSSVLRTRGPCRTRVRIVRMETPRLIAGAVADTSLTRSPAGQCGNHRMINCRTPFQTACRCSWRHAVAHMTKSGNH